MGAEWGRERVCEFGCGTVIRRFPTTTVNLREKKEGKKYNMKKREKTSGTRRGRGREEKKEQEAVCAI